MDQGDAAPGQEQEDQRCRSREGHPLTRNPIAKDPDEKRPGGGPAGRHIASSASGAGGHHHDQLHEYEQFSKLLDKQHNESTL